MSEESTGSERSLVEKLEAIFNDQQDQIEYLRGEYAKYRSLYNEARKREKLRKEIIDNSKELRYANRKLSREIVRDERKLIENVLYAIAENPELIDLNELQILLFVKKKFRVHAPKMIINGKRAQRDAGKLVEAGYLSKWKHLKTLYCITQAGVDRIDRIINFIYENYR